MKTHLAIHSYPGGNATLERHWPYFQRQKADEVWGIGTRDGDCRWPDNIAWMDICENRYIDGPALPERMIDTISMLFPMDWDILIVCEYDTLFLNRIHVERMAAPMAAHFAGGKTWESKSNSFYHNPWVFKRDACLPFVDEGRKVIEEGLCPGRLQGQAATPECSPDVFFGLIAERTGMEVDARLWREYSRNSMDLPGHLDGAREAYQNGVDIIHGIKTRHELDYITNP